MGRIKTAQIKRVTKNLFARHKQEFKTDFESNKKLVSQFAEFRSKKLRNVVAGYVTRIMRARAAEE